MRLVVDILTAAWIAAGFSGFAWRRRVKQQRRLHSPDYDHIKQLQQENREIDQMLADMKGEDNIVPLRRRTQHKR